jgi:hypothetical protein
MAALVLVLVMPVCVSVLMGVRAGLMLVLMPVMAVGTTCVAMFVLMLVLVVATHLASPPEYFLASKISISPGAVNGSLAHGARVL